MRFLAASRIGFCLASNNAGMAPSTCFAGITLVPKALHACATCRNGSQRDAMKHAQAMDCQAAANVMAAVQLTTACSPPDQLQNHLHSCDDHLWHLV